METISRVLVNTQILLIFCLFCFVTETLGDTKVGTVELQRNKRNPQNDKHAITTSSGGYHDMNEFRKDGTIEIIVKPKKNSGDVTATATRRDDENLNTQCTTPRKNVIVGAQSEAECAKHYKKFNPSLIYHIIAGKLASPGEYPYMAALGGPLITDNNEIQWYCGGSLITDRWVLTAAHCITNDPKIIVRLGAIFLNGTGGIDRTVKKIVKHHDYTSAYHYNDIALLELDQPVVIGDASGIRPVCLHTGQSDIAIGTKVKIAGWGQVEATSSRKSLELLHAEITTVSADACNASYHNYYANLLKTTRIPQGIRDGQLCAIDPSYFADTCEGDSGGPLQHNNDRDVPILHGVTSFGIMCATPIPGVYSRIFHYLDWIECIVWG